MKKIVLAGFLLGLSVPMQADLKGVIPRHPAKSLAAAGGALYAIGHYSKGKNDSLPRSLFCDTFKVVGVLMLVSSAALGVKNLAGWDLYDEETGVVRWFWSPEDKE